MPLIELKRCTLCGVLLPAGGEPRARTDDGACDAYRFTRSLMFTAAQYRQIDAQVALFRSFAETGEDERDDCRFFS